MQQQLQLARKEREQGCTTAAECDAGRFGKLPNEIATLEGLSFEATALAMRQCIRIGWYGLTQQATAAAFKPGKRRRLVKFENEAEEHRRCRLEEIETLPTGMGRDVYRRARRELTDKEIWECQRQGRGWSRARMLIGATEKKGHYRRVEGAWFDADTFGHKELAVVGYVRASHGVSPADIDKRFACSRPTTNKIVKGLLKGGWLRNDGTDARPIYRWAKDPVPLKISGATGRKFPVLTGLKTSGRKLNVNPDQKGSTQQGAKRHADAANILGIDRGGGTRRATPPKAHAENAKKRPPEGVAAPIEALLEAGVARNLIDKAHLWRLDIVGLLTRLETAIAQHQKAGDPIANVDAFFAVMVDNEIGPRCKLGAGTTVPNKKPAATIGSPRQSVFFPSGRAVKRAGRHAPPEIVNIVLEKFLSGGGHPNQAEADGAFERALNAARIEVRDRLRQPSRRHV